MGAAGGAGDGQVPALRAFGALAFDVARCITTRGGLVLGPNRIVYALCIFVLLFEESAGVDLGVT